MRYETSPPHDRLIKVDSLGVFEEIESRSSPFRTPSFPRVTRKNCCSSLTMRIHEYLRVLRAQVPYVLLPPFNSGFLGALHALALLRDLLPQLKIFSPPPCLLVPMLRVMRFLPDRGLFSFICDSGFAHSKIYSFLSVTSPKTSASSDDPWDGIPFSSRVTFGTVSQDCAPIRANGRQLRPSRFSFPPRS